MDPGLSRRRDCRPQNEYILDDAECLLFREFEESIEDDPRPKREANNGDGSYAQMAMNEYICEDSACRFRTVESIGPRIINEIAKFREN